MTVNDMFGVVYLHFFNEICGLMEMIQRKFIAGLSVHWYQFKESMETKGYPIEILSIEPEVKAITNLARECVKLYEKFRDLEVNDAYIVVRL